jgi:hypothetical protein
VVAVDSEKGGSFLRFGFLRRGKHVIFPHLCLFTPGLDIWGVFSFVLCALICGLVLDFVRVSRIGGHWACVSWCGFGKNWLVDSVVLGCLVCAGCFICLRL